MKLAIFIWTACLSCSMAAQYSYPSLVHALQDLALQIDAAHRFSNNINYSPFEIFRSIQSASSLPNVSSSCLNELNQMIVAYEQNQTWPLKVIDSIGKPSSGIYLGSLKWVGEYRQCRETKVNTWQGKYCTLSAPPSLNPAANPFGAALSVGVCVPSVCDNQDVANLVNFAIQFIPESITQLIPISISPIDATYVTCKGEKPLDARGIVAIIVISLILLAVLIGTIIDLIDIKKENSIKSADELNVNKKPEGSKLRRILASFSIYSNTVKLFKVTKTSGQIDCLHGIRFLSIGWIVLGHSYLLIGGKAENLTFIVELNKRFSFMILSNAGFSVDSFFLLSGTLTAYVFLNELKKKKLSGGVMIKYYLHRVWRITPPYMLVLMISACLTRFLGHGPLYPDDGYELDYCRTTWWTNLLYLNNFIYTDKAQSCFAVSWYLANDMQMYFIAPLILIPFSLGKKIMGITLSVGLIVIHILTTALIMNEYPGTENRFYNPDPANAITGLIYFDKLYIKPWCRIGPYAVGILLGYFLVDYKTKPKLNSRLNTILMIISVATLGVILFGVYQNNTDHPLNRVTNILYQATSRIIWALALGFLIYSSTINGGYINRLLSSSIWVPLSRLSFSLYLIHYTVITYYASVQEKPVHLQDSFLIFVFMGCISMSLVAAYLVSMLFEVPLIGLEKFVFNRAH